VKKILPDFEKAETFIVSLLDNELSPLLFYHNKEHTLDVLNVAMQIGDSEQISADERNLLRIAVLFHDSGFIYLYKRHEERGCEMAAEYLPGFGFTQNQIAQIKGMIMSTKVPQQPNNRLEQIIADADLDYLGRSDVYIIAQKLFEEMKMYGFFPDESEWIPFQIKFLRRQQYFTDYSKKFREANKNLYLGALEKKLMH
jgi:uncharacterized protein